MNRLQKGFTLIELVIVITIIAILAAIALPRYIAMQRDARVARIQSVLGTVRSATALARARCELDMVAIPVGTCTAAGGTANMDGLNITMVNRHPTANLAGILTAAGINGVNDGLTVSAGGAGAGVAITIDLTGATNPATCRVTYTSALANAAPLIALTGNAAGC